MSSSLFARSKEFPRSRKAPADSPPASPSAAARTLRVSGAGPGTAGRQVAVAAGLGAAPRSGDPGCSPGPGALVLCSLRFPKVVAILSCPLS